MAGTSASWVGDVADEVEQFVAQRGKQAGDPIVVASGISPSGPVHLGNLREVIVAHAVGEELRARGRLVRHLHFWDDYDRFRRVPASIPASFEEYVGRPLSDIPDPFGDCHPSYAEHFIADLDTALDTLRIRPEQIRQSIEYRSGRYTASIRQAIEQRGVIEEVLSRYRTRRSGSDDAASEEDEEEPQPLPLRVYCERCGRDSTESRLGPSAASLSYRCAGCGNEGELVIDEHLPAKLVWKVDWPMRWAYYRVDFEPGGVDHSSPGSSYDVGRELVGRVFSGVAPHYVGYSFVGIEGRSKLSSSAGDVPTPATALRVLEPRILRWQYIRRRPQSSFSVSFGSEILRLYDEWDSLEQRVGAGSANAAEQVFWRMSVRTSAGEVAGPSIKVPFRILAAAADVTQGNIEQMLRVVRAQTGDEETSTELRQDLEPRLACAIEWALAFQPEDERTHVRTHPAAASEVVVGPDDRAALGLLLERLEEFWSLDGLTTLVYGVPKLLAGLTLDAPADGEVKKRQREFFVLLYRLLVDAETGPRLPTLLLSIGRQHTEELLAPFA